MRRISTDPHTVERLSQQPVMSYRPLGHPYEGMDGRRWNRGRAGWLFLGDGPVLDVLDPFDLSPVADSLDFSDPRIPELDHWLREQRAIEIYITHIAVDFVSPFIGVAVAYKSRTEIKTALFFPYFGQLSRRVRGADFVGGREGTPPLDGPLRHAGPSSSRVNPRRGEDDFSPIRSLFSLFKHRGTFNNGYAGLVDNDPRTWPEQFGFGYLQRNDGLPDEFDGSSLHISVIVPQGGIRGEPGIRIGEFYLAVRGRGSIWTVPRTDERWSGYAGAGGLGPRMLSLPIPDDGREGGGSPERTAVDRGGYPLLVLLGEYSDLGQGGLLYSTIWLIVRPDFGLSRYGWLDLPVDEPPVYRTLERANIADRPWASFVVTRESGDPPGQQVSLRLCTIPGPQGEFMPPGDRDNPQFPWQRRFGLPSSPIPFNDREGLQLNVPSVRIDGPVIAPGEGLEIETTDRRVHASFVTGFAWFDAPGVFEEITDFAGAIVTIPGRVWYPLPLPDEALNDPMRIYDNLLLRPPRPLLRIDRFAVAGIPREILVDDPPQAVPFDAKEAFEAGFRGLDQGGGGGEAGPPPAPEDNAVAIFIAQSPADDVPVPPDLRWDVVAVSVEEAGERDRDVFVLLTRQTPFDRLVPPLLLLTLRTGLREWDIPTWFLNLNDPGRNFEGPWQDDDWFAP